MLTFMVGGTNFDEAKKVLENMGKNIIHCGPVGMGQVCIMTTLRSVKLTKSFWVNHRESAMWMTSKCPTQSERQDCGQDQEVMTETRCWAAFRKFLGRF